MWYLPEMFDADPLYALYTVALVIAGLLMIVLSTLDSGPTPLKRLGTVALGLLFLGYGVYLYLFLPDSYLILWYVLILPVLVTVNVVRSFVAKRRAAELTSGLPVTEQAPPAFEQA